MISATNLQVIRDKELCIYTHTHISKDIERGGKEEDRDGVTYNNR